MRARAPRFEFTRAPRSQTLIGKTFGLYQSSNEKKKGRVPDIQAVRPVSFRNQRKFIGLGGGGGGGGWKNNEGGVPPRPLPWIHHTAFSFSELPVNQ